MYCTGGIRCERGSAYLRSKVRYHSECDSVEQMRLLQGWPVIYFTGKCLRV